MTTRTEIYDLITKMVKYYHFVELKKPEVAIFVYTIKSVCCISLVDQYTELYELNINKIKSWHEEQNKLKSNEQIAEAAPKEEEAKQETQETSPVKGKRKMDILRSTESTTETSDTTSEAETAPLKKKRKKAIVGGIHLF
jgi:hypothetical protein